MLNSIESIDLAKEVAILWGSNQCDINESQVDYEEKKEDVINIDDDPIKRIVEINY